MSELLLFPLGHVDGPELLGVTNLANEEVVCLDENWSMDSGIPEAQIENPDLPLPTGGTSDKLLVYMFWSQTPYLYMVFYRV